MIPLPIIGNFMRHRLIEAECAENIYLTNIMHCEVGSMTLLLGILTVVRAGIAMAFHKLADMPKSEVLMWIITFTLFVCFEALLHR